MRTRMITSPPSLWIPPCHFGVSLDLGFPTSPQEIRKFSSPMALRRAPE